MAATINLKVNSDFAAASADLKKFGTIAESERKRIEKFVDSFKSESIDKFTDKARRNAAAIKATRGPVDALTAEYKQYQRQIETLIRRGLDPESKQIKTLTTRYKKLEKEIKDVGKAQAKNQKRMKVTQGAMLAVGAGAVLMGKQGASAFIDFSKESAQAASDAEEIEGKFNVVFRSIGDEATAAASTIAKDFDLAASTVNKLLGDTGDILTGLGFDAETALELSESVGTLALDLASFTNFAGGAEGASAALTKALLGEAESAKALGIVIRQDTVEYKDLVSGIMEAEQVGLIQAKALAALQIATEQSKNAIGDYARTINSTANVTRRLEESQKLLNEAWGVSINEGLTPLKSILIDVTRGFAELIKEANEANKVMKNLRDGGDVSGASLDALQDSLARLNAERAAGAALGVNKNIDIEIAALEGLIAAYGTQDVFLIKAAESARVLAQVDIDTAQRKQAQLDLQLSAEQKLEELRVESLTADEKKIENLQTQIDHWASVKTNMEDTATVQKIINELYAQRNELQKKEIDDTETQRALTLATWEERIELEQAQLDHFIQFDVLQTAAAERREEESENAAIAAKQREDEFKSMAATLSGFVSGPLEAMGAALVEGESGWDNFARVGVGAVAEVVRALAKMAVIESALRFARLDFRGGIAFAAAATAGFVAAGAIDAAASRLQEGGSFTTQGPTPILVGDNIGGQERVTVEPVSSTGLNTEGASQEQQSGPMILRIDGRDFNGWLQSEFDNGKLRIPRRLIV